MMVQSFAGMTKVDWKRSRVPEHGEYANSTFFVTELPHRVDRLHIQIESRQCQGIALTTDGLIDIAFDNPLGECQPWAPFFDPLIETPAHGSR